MKVGEKIVVAVVTALLGFGVATAAECEELMSRIKVPEPEGYVRILADSELYRLLDKAESADTENKTLARFIRADAVDEEGNIRDGANIADGLMSLRVIKKLKGRTFSYADVAKYRDEMSSELEASIRANKRSDLAKKAAAAQDDALKSVGVETKTTLGEIETVGCDKVGTRALAFGVMRQEFLESEGKTETYYDVSSQFQAWCEGSLFTLTRLALVDDPGKAKKAHEASVQALNAWFEAIRTASVLPGDEVLRYADRKQKGAPGTGSGNAFSGASSNALICALVGGVIGAVMSLLRKRRQ